MNKSSIAAVGMAVLLAAGTTLAQDAKAPAQAAKAAQPATGVDAKAQMGRMDEQIGRMQALHDKLTSAKTPEERQKLMAEQRTSMQEGMGMMNQTMQGGGMMGGGMGGGMMGQQAARRPRMRSCR